MTRQNNQILPYLASRIFETPLLIHRSKLDVILSVIGPRLGINSLDGVDISKAMGDQSLTYRDYQDYVGSSIAVIPVYGTLVKRTFGVEAASGLMSYREIEDQLNAALANSNVAGILLDIDSYGGEVNGCFELARHVREASTVKTIWAVANDVAFSSAYAIASAAERIIVTETGGVGSIGVIAIHIDQSMRDTMEGYRYTAIFAGQRKNDFSPHEPLTDTAKAELQAEVNRIYDIFVSHVAEMRGMSESEVRDTEAALYFGSNAVSVGLADAVGTLKSTLNEFSDYLSSNNRQLPKARVAARIGAINTKEEVKMNNNVVSETIGADKADALVAEARHEATQTAQAIVELCLIAGCPEKASAFIAEGKSEADVRKILCEAKALRSESTPIQSFVTLEVGTETTEHPDKSPVVLAVKKLFCKEE